MNYNVLNKIVYQAIADVGLPVIKICKKYKNSDKKYLNGVFVELTSKRPFGECLLLNKSIFENQVCFSLHLCFSYFKNDFFLNGPYEDQIDLMNYFWKNNYDIAESWGAGWYNLGVSQEECYHTLLRHIEWYCALRDKLFEDAVSQFVTNSILIRALELAKYNLHDDNVKIIIIDKLKEERLSHSWGYYYEYIAKQAIQIVKDGYY